MTYISKLTFIFSIASLILIGAIFHLPGHVSAQEPSVSSSESTASLTAEERELAELINDYREEQGLSPMKISKSLTETARAHVQDSNQNRPEQGGQNCNLHSWSDQGNWTPVCYTSDHTYASLMWNKPAEITDGIYSGNGYEISARSSAGAVPAEILNRWKNSSGHNNVIVGNGAWDSLIVMGVAIDGEYSHVWFGMDEDPAGYFDLSDFSQPLKETITAIDALPSPDNLQPDDEKAVEEVRAMVNSLLEKGIAEKDITNLDKLEMLETRLDELLQTDELLQETIAAIEALPSTDNLQLKDKETVEEARAMVDALLEKGIAEEDITNLPLLLAVEERLAAMNVSFPDVSNDHLFSEEIVFLAGQGIIQGFPDGSFRPDDPVSRAEVTMMISRLQGFDTKQRNTIFPDVHEAFFASGAIQTAAEKGIIEGFPNGTFEPYSSITRADMAMILQRTFNLEGAGPDFGDVNERRLFL
jgi:hypothetical protein